MFRTSSVADFLKRIRHMKVKKDNPGQLAPQSYNFKAQKPFAKVSGILWLILNIAKCETREDVKVLSVYIS